jgi:hypothetical protein
MTFLANDILVEECHKCLFLITLDSILPTQMASQAPSCIVGATLAVALGEAGKGLASVPYFSLSPADFFMVVHGLGKHLLARVPSRINQLCLSSFVSLRMTHKRINMINEA